MTCYVKALPLPLRAGKKPRGKPIHTPQKICGTLCVLVYDARDDPSLGLRDFKRHIKNSVIQRLTY